MYVGSVLVYLKNAKVVLPNATTKTVLYCTELSLDLWMQKRFSNEFWLLLSPKNLHFVKRDQRLYRYIENSKSLVKLLKARFKLNSQNCFMWSLTWFFGSCSRSSSGSDHTLSGIRDSLAASRPSRSIFNIFSNYLSPQALFYLKLSYVL